MGSLFYGSSASPIRMPDRILAHIKVVVATKLRRGESFTMSWRHPSGEPTGRSTLWIQPSIPLRFVFASAEAEVLDPALLHSLANSANSSGGLTLELDDVTEAVTSDAR
ncbi:hypothetical protein QE418_002187 [Microbacterium testaceum]|uniref:DUF7882 family protein n=1 Tax=Microbacterium TaxID=33882 RepID=UPI001AEB642A|nr:MULTISPECIES: hypothetical protein [Microbacterium]MDQ1112739.1 hypothetical protein [Microbacterium testaceum]MDR6096722.1 hypothetical protein [Microbacterium sp. SORGH_AS_0454]